MQVGVDGIKIIPGDLLSHPQIHHLFSSQSQVDGEPWVQRGPAELSVALRAGSKGVVLRRLPANSPAARMSVLVQEVLEASARQVGY